MLSPDFLSPYRKAGDRFPNLLARSTYLGKYCRNGETWTDTIARVVEANIALDPNANYLEAEMLFSKMWAGQILPPGRGLWTGGVPGIPVDARYNCHYGTLRSPDDWCWAANMLMCGGGVGIGLQRINELPVVQRSFARLHILCSRSHANVDEVMPDPFIADPSDCQWVLVDDSREGWVAALRAALNSAFEGKSIVVNVSSVRKRGLPLKTFGGVACGPAPLATLLRQVWGLIRSAQGRKLSSVECLDITNFIGVCIKSGNVRRSALIVLGDSNDQAFRDAKKDWNAVMAHRHSSNNSIVFETEEQIDTFKWPSLVEDNAEFGEPGILNLWKIRQTDPQAEGVNPCGEIQLHDREACCLAEVYPALMGDKFDVEDAMKLITRYTLRQRLQPMSDARADEARRNNMRIGVGLGGICDFEWTPAQLSAWRSLVDKTARDYADELGVARPIATTTVKPSGTISLLNGSSPGIHAPFAPFYIRRTRIGKHEAMAEALLEAGVPSEPCIYDVTGQTLVFSFPMAAANTAVTVQNQTVKSQIVRQVEVQEAWANNAVSSTISFAPDEKIELADALKYYAKDLKSISCLPKQHGYAQPPYEVVDSDTFAKMHAAINYQHPLTVGGELDTLECEGGVCPVK
jgi:ribonucleoside-triphosphate reductase (thioredoxin)